jgi:hypothetical protein
MAEDWKKGLKKSYKGATLSSLTSDGVMPMLNYGTTNNFDN